MFQGLQAMPDLTWLSMSCVAGVLLLSLTRCHVDSGIDQLAFTCNGPASQPDIVTRAACEPFTSILA